MVKRCTAPALRGVDEAFEVEGRRNAWVIGDQQAAKISKLRTGARCERAISTLEPSVMLFLQRPLQSQKASEDAECDSHLMDASGSPASAACSLLRRWVRQRRPMRSSAASTLMADRARRVPHGLPAALAVVPSSR